MIYAGLSAPKPLIAERLRTSAWMLGMIKQTGPFETKDYIEASNSTARGKP